jgi:hypothetical protein
MDRFALRTEQVQDKLPLLQIIVARRLIVDTQKKVEHIGDR